MIPRLATVGSLFAGIGGFDLAFERQGFKTVWQVEIDKHCLKLLEAKFPDAERYTDVREIGRHNLKPVDIIVGGFPCQDLSVAGRRAGLKGGRSGLWWEMRRIIDELKPALVIWENVPGLSSSEDGRDLAAVIASLGELFYFGCGRIIDSQWLGVAQRRRRWFGVFARRDLGVQCCAEILSIAESLRGHPAPSRQAGQGAAAGAEGGVGSRGEQSVCPPIAGCSNGGGANGPGRDVDSCESLVVSTSHGDQYKCGWCCHTEHHTEHVSACPECDSNGYENVMIEPTMGPNAGKRFNFGIGKYIDPVVAIPISADADRQNSSALTPSPDAEGRIRLRDPGVGIGKEGDPSFTLQSTKPQAVATNVVAQPFVMSTGVQGQEALAITYSGARDKTKLGLSDVNPALAANPMSDRLPLVMSTGQANAEIANDRCPTLNCDHEQPIVAVGTDCYNGAVTGDVAATLGTPGSSVNASGPTVMSSMVVRRLTPTECERLQSFPDGWTSGFSDSSRYKMLGNAVTVNVVEWIAKRIKSQIADLKSEIGT